MSSANDIKAGGAYVEVTANDKPMEARLKIAQQRLRSFAAQAQKLGKVTLKSSGKLGAGVAGEVRQAFDAGVSALNRARRATLASLKPVSNRIDSAFQRGRGGIEKLGDRSQLADNVFRGGQATTAGGAALVKGAAGILLPLKAAVSSYTTLGDQFEKASLRTGVSIEKLSALTYAAGQSGVEFATLEQSLRKMQDALGAAFQGTGPAIQSLESLGIRVDELRGLSPDDQFKRIGDAISKVEDPATRTALAMDLFGRSGVGVLPLFAQGAAGVDALTERFESLGLAIDADSARDAVALGDAFADVGAVLKAVGYQIGSALAPALRSITDLILRNARAIIGFIKDNRSLVIAVAALGVSMAGLGAVLLTVGAAIKIVGSFILPVQIGMKLLTLTATALQTALLLLVSPLKLVSGLLALTSAMLGALLTPAGIAVAALALLAVMAVTLTNALEPLKRAWADLAGVVDMTLSAVRDRLLAGDIEGAAEVLWAGLRSVWTIGIARLKEAWFTFARDLLRAGAEAFVGLAAWSGDAVEGLLSGWVSLKRWFAGFWADWLNLGSEAWNLLFLLGEKTINNIRKSLNPLFFDLAEANEQAEARFAQRQQSAQRSRNERLGSYHANADEQRDLLRKNNHADQARLAGSLADLNAEIARSAEVWKQQTQTQIDAEKEALRQRVEAVTNLPQPEPPALPPSPPPVDMESLLDSDALAEQVSRVLDGANVAVSQADSAAAVGSFDARSLGFLNRNTEAKETAANTREAVRWLRRLAESDGFTFA